MSKQMGFLVKPLAAKISPVTPAKNDVVVMDSGHSISPAEACINTSVFGSTGSGKTTCVILPASAALIEAGYGGLVVDIKASMTGQIRQIAKNRGRESDVVEYGSCANASRVNLLEGLDIKQVRELLHLVATFQFGNHTNNLDWHTKGVGVATDCIEMLRYIKSKHHELPVTLLTLSQLLNDWPLAARFFQYFKKNIYMESDNKQKEFVKRVESDNFTPLFYDAKKEKDKTFIEQTTWRLWAIRNGLDVFLESPGIRHNFTSLSDGIDIERLVYDEKKIVVLRFDATTGAVGSLVSRHVLTAFHKAVYARGLALKNDEYTFFVGDEFQEFADFDPAHRYNDNSFAAKAREFRAIQIVGTQSISSLSSRGASPAGVMEFINNINNRIVLYNDDPVTQMTMERYDADIRLNRLNPGEAFVVRFDASTRRHLHSLETFQKAHDRLREELRDVPAPSEHEVGGEPVDAPETSMAAILEVLEANVPPSPETFKEAPKVMPKAATKVAWPMYAEDDDALAMADDPEPPTAAPPAHMAGLLARHPEVFAKRGKAHRIIIPKGWVRATESAIKVVQAMGLTLEIVEMRLHCGALVAMTSTRTASLAESILTDLLSATRALCPLCGRRIEDGSQVVCERCRKVHSLEAAIVDHDDYGTGVNNLR